MTTIREKEECLQYLIDYVFTSARFVEETQDGYIFECFDETSEKWNTKVKVFKGTNIRLDYYEELEEDA